jgi:hypothetical protein
MCVRVYGCLFLVSRHMPRQQSSAPPLLLLPFERHQPSSFFQCSQYSPRMKQRNNTSIFLGFLSVCVFLLLSFCFLTCRNRLVVVMQNHIYTSTHPYLYTHLHTNTNTSAFQFLSFFTCTFASSLHLSFIPQTPPLPAFAA